MAKITIIVQGIAISYYKNDGLWKILFPFGKSHLITFKESSTDKGITLAKSGRSIEITAENAESDFEIGANYKDFLDLTDECSHSSGVNPKKDWEDRAVLMTVENAKFSVHEYTKYKHFILKGINVNSTPKKIGYSGKFEIESESITINVDGHPEFPKVFDSDCMLVFDNDCHDDRPKTSGDFEMVYNVIEDVQDSAQQFTVATVPKNRLKSLLPGMTFIPQVAEDPDRDPQYKNLPCHIVRISLTENLP